jgi:hypothetical protein
MLDNWKRQAQKHWQEFQPGRVKALKKAGTLDRELEAAAKLTHRLLQERMNEGASHAEAWEAVKQLYLFPPPEKGVMEADEREIENAPPSLAYEAIKEMIAMEQKFNEEEDLDQEDQTTA